MLWGETPEDRLPDEVLEDKPEVWEENLAIYRAFWHLNPERYHLGGEGVIPVPAIIAYTGHPEVQLPFLEVLTLIRRLDKAYLDYRQRQDEVKKKNADRHKRWSKR